MRTGFPIARSGMVIGLLGGSFDPPHRGHVHISLHAMRRFGLDRIWWLVSPGNPLKSEGPAPLSRRISASRGMLCHPRIVVTDVEARIGTRYTAETLPVLARMYPGVRFVWLMGSDNLATFHRWDNWQQIMRQVNIGVIARPGYGMAARLSPAARRFAAARLPESAARLLGRSDPPSWCLINVPLTAFSSSEIRARGEWPR